MKSGFYVCVINPFMYAFVICMWAFLKQCVVENCTFFYQKQETDDYDELTCNFLQKPS